MRIVDVAAFYTPYGGGVKTYIDRKLLARPRRRPRNDLHRPRPGYRTEERGPNARIVYLENPQFPLDRRYHYFRDVETLHATLDQLQPDVVECSSPWRSARYVGEWAGTAPRALIMHADPMSAYAYRWFDPSSRARSSTGASARSGGSCSAWTSFTTGRSPRAKIRPTGCSRAA